MVTWDGSATAANVKIYINGAETSYQTTTNGVTTKNSDASADFIIGNNSLTTQTFNGLIDEVRVYNRALSAAEVMSLYNSR